MIYVLVSHPVQNFETWKPVFDSDQPRVKNAGLTLHNIFRSAENPNDVSILFSAANKAVIETCMQDPALPILMEKSGVLAHPTVQFFNEA